MSWTQVQEEEVVKEDVLETVMLTTWKQMDGLRLELLKLGGAG